MLAPSVLRDFHRVNHKVFSVHPVVTRNTVIINLEIKLVTVYLERFYPYLVGFFSVSLRLEHFGICQDTGRGWVNLATIGSN